MTRLLSGISAALLLVLALAVPAGAANPDPPAAVTAAPDAITLTGATLKATVTPNGAATTYRFEYGTSDSYGLTTAEKDAGSGTDPVSVSVPVTGLTSDTTYHVRVVATNAAGVTAEPGPHVPHARPRARRRRVDQLGDERARGLRPAAREARPARAEHDLPLRVRADDEVRQRDAVRRRLVVGLQDRLGHDRGPDPVHDLPLPARGLGPGGDEPRRATAPSARCAPRRASRSPRRRTRWTGARRSRSPARCSARASAAPASSVQRSDFPFTRGFWIPRTFSAGKDARFSTTIGPLWETTRLQLVTRTTTVARSPVVTIGVRVRVGVRRQAAGRRAIVLGGVDPPGRPAGARLGAAPHARGRLGARRARRA